MKRSPIWAYSWQHRWCVSPGKWGWTLVWIPEKAELLLSGLIVVDRLWAFSGLNDHKHFIITMLAYKYWKATAPLPLVPTPMQYCSWSYKPMTGRHWFIPYFLIVQKTRVGVQSTWSTEECLSSDATPPWNLPPLDPFPTPLVSSTTATSISVSC